MGEIRKINDVYYIEFYARGLLYSQIAGHDYNKAQELLERIEKTIAGGEALTIVRHIDLPVFAERFLDEARGQYGRKTVERFESTIKHFSGFLVQEHPDVKRLDQVTPVVMESYKACLAKTIEPRIVNLTILLMRDLLDFGIKLGFIHDNPSLHVRLLPWPKVSERKATERYDKVRQLIAQRIGLAKIARLLKITDAGRLIYYAHLIPLSREDAYH